MNWPEEQRWRHLWSAVGATGDATAWYERLTRAYAEPQRHYHNQQHLSECLAEFDSARTLAQQPVAVELALWFHDAVYDPKASDNEERSAELAKECLIQAGQANLAAVVARLVMATKTHQTDGDLDAALLIDVDLSILGQDERRFGEYETQIREEYRHVPGPIFNFKRAEILERFLKQDHIYATEYFARKFEQSARRNLEGSIRKLRRLWG